MLPQKLITLNFPTIDILVLNAGIYVENTIDDFTRNNLETIMQTNVYSSMHIIQMLLPQVRKSTNGKIIFIGSSAELREHHSILYSMSKWAQRSLAINLRYCLMKDNIGVSIIYPGAVNTEM